MRQMCGFDDGKPAVDFIKVMDKRTAKRASCGCALNIRTSIRAHLVCSRTSTASLRRYEPNLVRHLLQPLHRQALEKVRRVD